MVFMLQHKNQSFMHNNGHRINIVLLKKFMSCPCPNEIVGPTCFAKMLNLPASPTGSTSNSTKELLKGPALENNLKQLEREK